MSINANLTLTLPLKPDYNSNPNRKPVTLLNLLTLLPPASILHAVAAIVIIVCEQIRLRSVMDAFRRYPDPLQTLPDAFYYDWCSGMCFNVYCKFEKKCLFFAFLK